MRAMLCFAILAAAACGQTPPSAQSTKAYSRDDEIALGQSLSALFRQQTTALDDNAAFLYYVKRVGANLAAQLPGGWTYQFYLIKEDEERETHEPTAFPGGHIFVSQELVMEALNEEEFAGMLAHAMAHVAEPHRKQLDAQQGPVTRLGILYVRADFGALSAFDSQVRPMALLKVLSVVERKADTGAVQAMAAAGYDPAGLWSYLEGIRPVRRSGQMSKMFATLPPVEERVAAIKKQILGLPARTYQPGYEFTRLQAEFKSATIKKPDTAPTLIRKTTPDLSH